ncbi:MAG TPA: TIGR02281 family clan AA aspartic protease [Sphingomicrobium sp.]|nr:TIGR02281 family clan AA aspartic protease [Sphingomicrobium sp.]
MTALPDWQHLAIYAVGIAVIVVILQRLPYVGRIFRFLLSFAILAFAVFLVLQQAPYQPTLARFTQQLGLDNQTVEGKELRVRMSPDGHFWVNATINGVKRRMLIDSGATVTAISQETVRAAGVDTGMGVAPVILRTANGATPAQTGTIEELRVGNILARDIKVVSAPGLGLDVIGMNFLSELQSWRVEDRTLVLVPHHPQN